MKRVLGHCLAGLAVVAGGVGVMSACAHNDSSLFIQDVIYLIPVAAGQVCSYTADPNQLFQSSGTLDVAFRDQYFAEFLVANQLVAQSNSAQLMTETSTVNIEGAIVRVTDAAGNQLDSFTSLAAGTVYPSTGTVPGYAAIGATIASRASIKAVVGAKGAGLGLGGSTTIVTYSKFFGHTLGGTYVESNEFEYPIEVCEGCLVTFSESLSNCNGVMLKGPNCLGAQASGSTLSTLPIPCTVGQDTAIDCSQCQGTAACQGVYATAPVPGGCLDAGGGG